MTQPFNWLGLGQIIYKFSAFLLDRLVYGNVGLNLIPSENSWESTGLYISFEVVRNVEPNESDCFAVRKLGGWDFNLFKMDAFLLSPWTS